MRRFGWIVLVVACGKKEAPPPHPYTHLDPAFTIDLPAGYQPGHESRDPFEGEWIAFDGPHPFMVSWELEDESAVEARDATAQTQTSLGNPVSGQGDLAGGGAWVITDAKGEGEGIDAYLVADGKLLDCTGEGPALAACKTLRGK